MPEITAIHIALPALAVVVGGVTGWIARGNRARQEKAAINAGWHEQMEAQRIEHGRLVGQNKSLMDQISQYQASNQDAKRRAKELSEVAQNAHARRDELQREIKDVRSNLETVLSQRDKLRSDIVNQDVEKAAFEQKDEKIFQLSRELESWHNRLPPLIERYRVRNEEAVQLEADLAKARRRIEELETANCNDQTRIEPVHDPDALTNGRDASNDPTEHQNGPQVDSVETASHEDGQHSLRDDLKQIKGIGPAIEKTLNEMGIFRLQQIADMTEYDIDRVAERLKGFHSRIYRENWIGQARELKDHNRRA
jgi:predicted flap endonuclease-1-like 5' DNA nuclease